MRPIPSELREQLEADPFMKRCIYTLPGAPNNACRGRIEWEHAFVYKQQINEVWAIVGCCTAHNRGNAMVKSYNRYIALVRAKELGLWDEVKTKYPRHDWDQEFKYLSSLYEKNKISTK